MPNFSGLPVGMPFGPDERTTTQQLPLGTKAFDSAGNEYTYVKAGAAIANMEAVTFNGSAAGFDDVRKTSAVNQLLVGVATAAFSANDYGFILTRGIVKCLAVDATAVGSLVVPSATAGVVKLATEAESLAGSRSASLLVADANSDTVGATICLW